MTAILSVRTTNSFEKYTPTHEVKQKKSSQTRLAETGDRMYTIIHTWINDTFHENINLILKIPKCEWNVLLCATPDEL